MFGVEGVFNQFNNTTTSPSGSLGQGPNNIFDITQSFSVITPTISGSVTTIHDSQDEFYNGELSGSVVLVTNGELNPGCEQFKNPNFVAANFKLRLYYESQGYTENTFLDPLNSPTNGCISMFHGAPPSNPLAPVAPTR